MKNRRGMTLIEVILTLALISLVIVLPFNLFGFSNKVEKLAMTEAEIQASSRLISEYVNNITRFATKTHTIPKSSFQHSENGVRDPITSYIGITKDGHVVIDKPGATVDDPRVVQYVAEKQDGIEFEIIFNKVTDINGKPIDTVLNFSIIGKRDGKIVTEIASNVEIMNSLQIDYLGTVDDPAVALAFSMVDPGSQEWIDISPDAYITMVLDVSGSMDWDMDGKDNSTNDKRIDILKYNANKMIDRLANMDFNIHVSLVPFSGTANNPKPFYNVNDESELATIKSLISGLSAYGGTNTGDGIRRGFYQLKNKTDPIISSGKTYADITQHMMILVDGGTNLESYYRSGGYNYFLTSDGNTSRNGSPPVTEYIERIERVCYWWGCRNERVYEAIYDNRYVKMIGNIITSKTYEFEGETKQTINTFVIGFSNRTIDHSSLQDIGDSTNAKHFEHNSGTKPYIIATDADELDFAFGQFEAEVENSLWVITRPKLYP